jgi:hypothetical protein
MALRGEIAVCFRVIDSIRPDGVNPLAQDKTPAESRMDVDFSFLLGSNRVCMNREKRMRRAIDLTTSILILVTITGLVTAGSTEKPPAMTSADSESVVRDLVVIDVSERPRLRETGLPVIWKGAAFFLAEWDADQRDLAREIGIPFETLAPDLEPGHALHLFELPDGTLPPEAWRGRILLERGRRIVVAMDSAEAAT